LVRSDPDPHAVIGAPEEIHLGDAGDTEELVPEVDAAIVDEVVAVARPVRRVDGDEHEDARALLLHGDALRVDLLGQARLCSRDTVLGQDVGGVLVHAHREADVEQHAAIARVRRLHVDHSLDAVHLLLDRSGDRLLDGDGRGARIRRGDANDRWGEEGILLEREPRQRERPHDHDDDRYDDRDNRPADEKLRHDYPPLFVFPAGGRAGAFSNVEAGGFSAGTPALGRVSAFTSMPGRTFCMPSTITRSPALSPLLTMYQSSTRSSRVTGLNSTLFCASTTKTILAPCWSCTAS